MPSSPAPCSNRSNLLRAGQEALYSGSQVLRSLLPEPHSGVPHEPRRLQEATHVKHYFHPTSRAVTTDWMLKELDAPHEQIVIDFPAGENNSLNTARSTRWAKFHRS